MRIGTWNLAGRWDDRHLAAIRAMECDVFLLTEVSERVEIPEMHVHVGQVAMARKRRWAAVASRAPARPMVDPHGASAMAEVAGVTYCSSILPWKGAGSNWPGIGSTTAEKTFEAVASIECVAPHVWGGDWNHAMSGREWTGSIAGRKRILAAVERLSLKVQTSDASHQIDGLLSIDHIATPATWSMKSVERHIASLDGELLSDHDAYVVETTAL